MSMETKKPPHAPEPPAERGPGYERRDASIRGLLQFAFWMAVVLAVTLVAMRWTFKYYSRMAPLGPPASPFTNVRVLPPSPRLQANPHQELVDYCQAQEQEVRTYGWIDRRSGIVRIPVDRAMDLLLERGLPIRPASQTPATSAATVPAQSVPFIPEVQNVDGPCGFVTEPEPGAATEQQDQATEKESTEGQAEAK